MKYLKYIVTIPLVFNFVNVAHAAVHSFHAIPFANVEVLPENKINIEYHLEKNQTIVCTSSNNDLQTTAEWFYKDVTRKIELPITLKTDTAEGEGHKADATGLLSITNEYGPNSIYVTCNIGSETKNKN